MLTLSLPAVYTLELWPTCNNRCTVCSSSANHTNRRRPLPAEQWGRWMETFGWRAARIRISGGEPTFHPEFARIAQQACSYDVPVSIFTNARWRSPHSLLAQLRGLKNLTGLLISLHGARPETHDAFTAVPGSFVETVNNIRLARAYGIAVALSVVVSAYNAQELDAIVALARELDAEHVAFNRYIGTDTWPGRLAGAQLRRAVERIERLIAAGEPVRYANCLPQCFSTNQSEGCMAGVSQVTIDPWGSVRPCIYSPTVVGSLRNSSLEAIWAGTALRRWRAWEPAGCPACAAYAACPGGCRAAGEHQGVRQDPLLGEPFADFTDERPMDTLPAHGRPRQNLKLVPESFGYLLISAGEIAPVRQEAYAVLMACDGSRTVADMRQRFSAQEMELIQELWNNGMVEVL